MFIPYQDLTGKLTRPCLIYRRNWSQTSKSLIWTSAPWNLEYIFVLSKRQFLQNKFDIFTISETRTDLTVSDASLEISSYQFFRQDRGSHKNVDGLCIYAKLNLKITVLDDLSLACEDGFKQLWLRVQCRSRKSFLVCNTYRPPLTHLLAASKILLRALLMHYSWNWTLLSLET